MTTLPAHRVTDMAGLAAALHNDGPALIELAGDPFVLNGTIHLARAVTLRGAPGQGTELRLDGHDAGITIAAAGCALHHLSLTAAAKRGRPALLLHAAPGCHLSHLKVQGCEGVAIRASASPGLRLHAVAVQGCGLEALVLDGCDDAQGDIVLADIGLHGRVAGLDILDSDGFALHATAAGVNGSAVTIRGRTRAVARGTVSVAAEACDRGLSILGQADSPVSGITATVEGGPFTECGVMLVNVSAITLLRVAATGTAPWVRMDGRHGARDCLLVLQGAPGDAAVEMRGASRGNRIIHAARPEAARALRAEHRTVQDTCRVCGWHGSFRKTSHMLRETFYCPHCRANLRYRAQADALLALYGAGAASLRDLAEAGGLAALAVYEPGITGPLRPHLARAGRYAQSVYAASAQEGGAGAAHEGIDTQDLMACTHPDETFDLVVTSDILEHIRHPMRACAEIHRILRPGGPHVFSIPTMLPLAEHSVARVDTSGPADRHVLPAVYHGSGDGGRSLVYTDFGSDILGALAAIGFPTRILPYAGGTPHVPAITFVSQRPLRGG